MQILDPMLIGSEMLIQELQLAKRELKRCQSRGAVLEQRNRVLEAENAALRSEVLRLRDVRFSESD